jgi:predicted transcriptional regulator
MTPEQHREKWNLPPDYPMVAPNYAVAAQNSPSRWASAAAQRAALMRYVSAFDMNTLS